MYGHFVPSGFRGLSPGGRSLLFAKQSFGLHSIVTSAGYDRVGSPSYDWHGLKRGKEQWAVLQYTLSGQGRLSFEGRQYDVTPGTAMMLYFPHDNRYWLPAGGKWEFFFIAINGSEVLRAWRFAVARLGPLLTLGKDSPLLASAASICLRVLRQEIDTPWSASLAAYELCMRLLETAMPAPAPERRAARPESVERAIEFCRRNLAQEIGVEQLARAAGLSRYYFTRVFQASEGMAPGEFISRQRMREAVRLLQTTDQPVKSVALQCGYPDVSYFCKVFRNTFDVSPAAFRRSGMY